MNVTHEKIPGQLLPIVGALVLSLAVNGLFAAGFATSLDGNTVAAAQGHSRAVITVEPL